MSDGIEHQGTIGIKNKSYGLRLTFVAILIIIINTIITFGILRFYYPNSSPLQSYSMNRHSAKGQIVDFTTGPMSFSYYEKTIVMNFDISFKVGSNVPEKRFDENSRTMRKLKYYSVKEIMNFFKHSNYGVNSAPDDRDLNSLQGELQSLFRKNHLYLLKVRLMDYKIIKSDNDFGY